MDHLAAKLCEESQTVFEKAGKALFRCLYERKPQAPNMAMNLAVNLPPEDIQDLLRSVSAIPIVHRSRCYKAVVNLIMQNAFLVSECIPDTRASYTQDFLSDLSIDTIESEVAACMSVWKDNLGTQQHSDFATWVATEGTWREAAKDGISKAKDGISKAKDGISKAMDRYAGHLQMLRMLSMFEKVATRALHEQAATRANDQPYNEEFQTELWRNGAAKDLYDFASALDDH